MIKREVSYISYQDFLLKVLEMAEFLTYHRKKILVAFVISALLMTGLCGQLDGCDLERLTEGNRRKFD